MNTPSDRVSLLRRPHNNNHNNHNNHNSGNNRSNNGGSSSNGVSGKGDAALFEADEEEDEYHHLDYRPVTHNNNHHSNHYNVSNNGSNHGSSNDDRHSDSIASHASSQSSHYHEYTALEIEHNFKYFSSAFALNHGCMVCCVAYASTVLGDRLGSYGNGVLFIVFAFSAAFIAKPFVAKYGTKVALLVGVLGNFLYVASFFGAILSDKLDYTDDIDDTIIVEPRWAIFLVGCSIGGLAGGLLWTAQGRYFANSAHLFARESDDTTIEEANNAFAGLFAFYYLIIEMLLKVLATIIFYFEIYAWDSEAFVFGIYCCVCFLSTAMMLFVYEYGNEELTQLTIIDNCRESLKSVFLAITDLRLALILPFQVAFGFATSFLNYYIFGTVVSDSSSLGETYVGFLSALVVLTAALIAFPSVLLANKFGKPLVMTLGGICLTGFGAVCLIFSTAILGTWIMIVPVMIIFGLARGTWENANRAVVADFFADSADFSTSAFAAITFFNGAAAAVGYFMFYYMTRLEISGLVTVMGLVSVSCYLISVHLPSDAPSRQRSGSQSSGRSPPSPMIV